MFAVSRSVERVRESDTTVTAVMYRLHGEFRANRLIAMSPGIAELNAQTIDKRSMV